ncbi:hypothetical protein BASA81_002204 [Batrachochytrium salamandrivorans]|nr:hypothetical protein BASA81_002204 [Batrachochytrium salamandrivorans]
MSSTSDQLFAIAILIDELKHEEVSHRVSSMQHLRDIANALGVERTQSELLPYLVDSCLDDEDEVLLAMAGELGQFTKQVGGNSHALIAPLEALANVEEPAVRDKAVQGLVNIALEMTPIQVEKYFCPLCKDLAKKDWFTSRITSAGLIPTVYGKIDSSLPTSALAKQELKQLFIELGKDDTPMVRKALASNFPDLVNKCEVEVVNKDLVPLFSQLAMDEHDSVRLLVCPIGIAICKRLGSSTSGMVSAQCITLAADKGWRVRWSVAQVFHELLGTSSNPNDLLPSFVQLIKDVEPEVRTAATANLTKTAKIVKNLDVILPLLQDLCQDQSEHVREALALVVLGLAPIVGKQDTVKHLLPWFLLLLRDSNPQVRLGMVGELASLEGVVSIDDLSVALLPAVIELAHDKNWRVRAQTIAHLPVLAKQMELAYFEANLMDICVHFLSDQVFTVREAGAGLVMQICKVFGTEWTLKKIVPSVQALKLTNNYLYRLTAVRSMEVLMQAVDAEVTNRVLIPFILSLANDPVPNVRFGVCKALKRTKLAKDHAEVKECLQRLTVDKDKDVVFFAKRALEVVTA